MTDNIKSLELLPCPGYGEDCYEVPNNPDIYYKESHDNFYSKKNKAGMGNSFHGEHIHLMKRDNQKENNIKSLCAKIAKRVEKEFGSTIMYDASYILEEETPHLLAIIKELQSIVQSQLKNLTRLYAEGIRDQQIIKRQREALEWLDCQAVYPEIDQTIREALALLISSLS